MNYRLGSFGWLAGPELLRAGGTANLGFYDQHLALLWVKDNIWRFGGNPDEVTVFGESAGASSILHHITAHGGLGDAPPFQRAILQSPAFFPQPEPTQQLEAYEKLLNATGTHSLRELRGLNSTDLILANSKVVQRSNYGQFTFGPVIDGFYVPALPGVSLHEGHYHRNIDIMTAYNELEGLLFTPPYIQTNESFRAYLHSVFPAAPDSAIERIEELYPPRKPGLIGEAAARINRLAQALGDAAVNCNTHYLQSAVAEYEPNRIGRGYYFAVPGAIHSLDVFYTVSLLILGPASYLVCFALSRTPVPSLADPQVLCIALHMLPTRPHPSISSILLSFSTILKTNRKRPRFKRPKPKPCSGTWSTSPKQATLTLPPISACLSSRDTARTNRS